MVRIVLLLVKLLSICSGGSSVHLREPAEHRARREPLRLRGSSLNLNDVSEPTYSSENGNLTVNLTFGHVYLPTEMTGLDVELHLLGFNGVHPGPTLRVRAGDTLRIRLHNGMRPELVNTTSVDHGFTSGYRGFDTVNLHTCASQTPCRPPAGVLLAPCYTARANTPPPRPRARPATLSVHD